MIPPKGDWHKFENDNEKLAFLREIGLIPKTKGLRTIFYTGPYQVPSRTCDVVGYETVNTLVIRIGNNLHCINTDCLLEMQSFTVADEYKIEYIKNPAKSPTSFVVFDFEATDRNHRVAEIVEIGAVKYEDGRKTDTYNQLVCPDCQMSFFAREVNKITDDMLDGQPTIEQVLPKFVSFIGDLPLIAFNGARYDFKIMERKCSELKIPFSASGYDAMEVSKKKLHCPAGNRLDDMRDYYGLGGASHRALGDAEATAEIWKMCFREQFPDAANPDCPGSEAADSKQKTDPPAFWDETLLLKEQYISALKNTGLDYDLSLIAAVHRAPEKSAETEALITAGNTIFLVKKKKNREVAYSDRLKKILDEVGAKPRQLSGDYRLYPQELVSLLQTTNLAQLLYEACLSDADSFSCCSSYEACSDAKKCIKTDPMFYARCHYRQNLIDGKIFYGKNKTI